MRSVVVTGPGELELNYMWLPTFIGMDSRLKQELETTLAKTIEGKSLDDSTLEWAHEQVMDFLCKRYPIAGLREHIDSLKFIPET